MPTHTLARLAPFRDGQNTVNVIVETPKGSRNKYNYNPDLEVFELGGVQPEGSTFPYDFGFVPSTKGGDGDPLDVLLIMDEPAPMGCLVEARLIGVIEAEQTEDGEAGRNDRLLAVAEHAKTHSHIKTLTDLRPGLLDEIEHFFIAYNQVKGKEFKPLRRGDAETARKLVEESRTDG